MVDRIFDRKHMKRTTTLLLGILLAVGMTAQDEMGGFGFHIGYASPTLRLNSPTAASSKILEAIPMNGFKAGISYDATIVKGFGTTFGLNYTFGTYYSKWTSVGSMSTDQTRYHDSYQGLEIFCDWQYKFEIAGDTYLMLYTGPTIQCHLSLSEQEYVRSATGDTKQQTRYGYEYRDNEAFQDFKRVNVTWGVGAGFQYRQFFVRGGYDFGLINPYKYDTFKAMGVASDYWTRGRFDQWQVKLGMYIWQF